jgi:hypothetical protein
MAASRIEPSNVDGTAGRRFLSLSLPPLFAPPALNKGLGVSLTPAGSTDSAADERIRKKQGTR